MVVEISVAIPDNPFNLKRGDLKIELLSPSGTLSVLLQPRPQDRYPDKYVDWSFMSVMFWGESPTGQWTLTVKTRDVTGVANVSRAEFLFYGVSEVPEAVANIPQQCHPNCTRGCAREGSNYCDSCVNLRNAYTLECIHECPPGYSNRNSYCYNDSLPARECNSPLKNKDNFTATVSCSEAGFTECCTNGNCASAPSQPSSCFCDAPCHKFSDCCVDAGNIGCSEEDGTVGFTH